MILEAHERRMFVISDLHLGNPASRLGEELLTFLDHVEASGASLCINGDAFDILMSTWPTLVAGSLPVVRRLRNLREGGCHLFYLLGNHDIALEHVLLDLPITVSPFLNVVSGGRRFRIEHGHLSEPFYARYPDLYELGCRVSRHILVFNGDLYGWWARVQMYFDSRRRVNKTYHHYETAEALFARGFDGLVLGHTHLPERTQLENGLFVNGGDWLTHRSVVEIQDGEVSLFEWHG